MEIKIGDKYKGGTVISTGIQTATTKGIYGYANLPVDKRYIGKKWVVVEFSDRSTEQYWLMS